ncbi:exonuclease domain-containing protein [Bacillus sp. B1-b2]|uniref:exonuclease domain-containing protein n=1 Tax=Bacillus sp. B1-b2 TaxID=2653201 RepID=UPI001261E60D|nr:exonuclease domain-containing protein [Bacillus sp. B1-b2]KAB7671799.1 exonuclease [Bacillus sp. B1-b2]
MDFIAIDFEIANEDMASACSIGLAYVKNNEIVKEQYYLIKPPATTFDPRFTAIHGMTEKDVENERGFIEIWELLKDDLTNNILVAHNAQFDMSVLHCCLETNNIKKPELTYICSIPISTRAIRGQKVGQSLKERTSYFGISIGEHHHAGSDAKACAELVITSVKSRKKESLQHFYESYTTLPVKQFSEIKAQTSFGKSYKKPIKQPLKKFTSVSISDITPTVNTFNESHPFFEKNIVFTGDLSSLDRKEAMQSVVNAGGILKSGVSSKIDYLVVGIQDQKLVGKDGISSKEKKAYELQEKGKPIQVIKEEEFLGLLNRESLKY